MKNRSRNSVANTNYSTTQIEWCRIYTLASKIPLTVVELLPTVDLRDEDLRAGALRRSRCITKTHSHSGPRSHAYEFVTASLRTPGKVWSKPIVSRLFDNRPKVPQSTTRRDVKLILLHRHWSPQKSTEVYQCPDHCTLILPCELAQSE